MADEIQPAPGRQLPTHRDWHVVVNPVAGHGNAPESVKSHLLPLLDSQHITYHTHETQAVRDAGRIGRSILDSNQTGEPVTVVIAGGDGTAHEMIEGILEAVHQDAAVKVGTWNLIILPLGTANALHASLYPHQNVDIPASLEASIATSTPEVAHSLASVFSALTADSTPTRLPITLTRLTSKDTSSTPSDEVIPSHIVLSTSLHAALLSDSEALRATHPGLERFKMAAEKNLPVAFQANATLKGRIMQYSPKSGRFTEPFTAPQEANGEVVLQGPFSYFLSTTTVNRLEPTFVIAPTLSSHPATDQDVPTMDIIVLRPGRDPLIQKGRKDGASEDKIAEQRGKRLGETMGWAYKEGRHVGLTYVAGGSGEVEEKGDGEAVVEVFRCEGFEWSPTDASHDPSHLICADGSIHSIPKEGKALVSLMQASPLGGHSEGFFVWA